MIDTLLEILTIAFDTILPILLCAAVGFWFGRRFQPDPRMISRMSLYVLLPCLVFVSISESEIDPGEIGRVAVAVFAFSIAIAIFAWATSRTQPNLEPTATSAFILAVMLVNSGNYGLPFIEFAFGEEGLQRAAIIFVMTALVTYTIGIYIASSGTVTFARAVRNILTNPLPYAAALGFLANFTAFSLPTPVARSVGIFSEGSVPVLLLLLGVQLAAFRREDFDLSKLRLITFATLLKLIASPVLVAAIALLLDIDGLTRSVMIVQLSTPTAINAVVLSNEFGSDVRIVTPIILVTTLASVLTLSILLVIVT